MCLGLLVSLSEFAIALAAALFHGGQIEGEDVIVTISGGNVDEAVFARALARLGKEDV